MKMLYNILRKLRNAFYTSITLLRKKGIMTEIGRNVLLRGCSVSRNGGGNILVVEDGAMLTSCVFSLFGHNNRIIVHKNARLNNITFWMEDDNNLIEIGCASSMEGQSQLAACEGTSIIIGEDCMFSHQVNMSTTDSHAIEDLTGERINPAKDIRIGNHVWIGQKTLVLKGSCIADNCIVGACSLVNKNLNEPNSIYAGQPAHKVKGGINWNRER